MIAEQLNLGIDLGGTEIKAVVLTQDGEVLWSRKVETRAMDGRDAVLGRMVNLAEDARADLAPRPAGSVGVAVPGVIDMERGRIELLTNLSSDWNGFDARDALEADIGLPVALINDARAAALAEHAVGAARGYGNAICLAVGTGIGGALILDGELYFGSRGAAGEIGHATVAPDGRRCNCGNRGCLETVASATALTRAAREAIVQGDDELAALAGTWEPSAYQLAIAAGGGSLRARAIFAEAGCAIGLVLANLICALNPEAVIISGAVAGAGDLLLDPIRDEIARRTMVFSPERGGVEVLASPLGGRAGAIGAAAWGMRQRAYAGVKSR